MLPSSTHPPGLLLQVVQELIALGIIVPTSDLLSIRRSIAFFVSQINRQAEQQEAVAVRQLAGWLDGSLPALGRGLDPALLVVISGMPEALDNFFLTACLSTFPLLLLQTIGEDLFAIALVRHSTRRWASALPRHMPCPHPPRSCHTPFNKKHRPPSPAAGPALPLPRSLHFCAASLCHAGGHWQGTRP